MYVAKIDEIRAMAGPIVQRHFEKVEEDRRIVQERVEAEFSAIEDAVRRIAKAAESLSEIVTMASTVRSHGDKIRTRAERLQGDIDQQLLVLRQNVEGLKEHAGDEVVARQGSVHTETGSTAIRLLR